ncbi:uncharacterized protein HHUB_4232 (plasmid) [Halobacterium hubeiense]|uniref:Uncharacterized protein n=1 Tax=Halobacterium hubeiense TaxID=1407499 RepID=A0A0U5D1S1_9EURY|nr:uncharacterized protein HHUB_4232 [Halobacterium hubeiense]
MCEGTLFDDDLVDDLENTADDAWSTANDIADQLADGVGSLAEEGWDIVF